MCVRMRFSATGDKLHNLCFSLPVFYALFRPLSQHDRGDDDNDEYGDKEEDHQYDTSEDEEEGDNDTSEEENEV